MHVGSLVPVYGCYSDFGLSFDLLWPRRRKDYYRKSSQRKSNKCRVNIFLIELLPTSFLLFLNFSIDRKYNLSMAGFEQHDFRKSAIWYYDTLQDHCGLLGLRHVDREMAIEILID